MHGGFLITITLSLVRLMLKFLCAMDARSTHGFQLFLANPPRGKAPPLYFGQEQASRGGTIS